MPSLIEIDVVRIVYWFLSLTWQTPGSRVSSILQLVLVTGAGWCTLVKYDTSFAVAPEHAVLCTQHTRGYGE